MMKLTKLATLASVLLAAGLATGCNHSDRSSDRAADDVVAKQKALNRELDKDAEKAKTVDEKTAELNHAARHFEERKELRMMSLRSEQSMIVPQANMIESLAAQLPLTTDAHKDIDAKVQTFDQRIDDAKVKLNDLGTASADQWQSRDDAAGDAMKNLETARDDAWQAFKKAKRTDHSS